VNEGNAMDLTSGIFTAPRPGIYFFSFAGVADIESSGEYYNFTSFIILNGNLIGMSLIGDSSDYNNYSQFTLQSTLNLQKGDQLWVEINYGGSSFLYENGQHQTHFMGFMLKEEIVASL
jgi:hypothetical protein